MRRGLALVPVAAEGEALAADVVEALLADVALRIADEHRQVSEALGRGLEHARRAGGLLIHVKSRLPHGAFLPWLDANCPMSRRTAQAYMKIAREWTRLEARAKRVAHLNDLPMREALTMLATSREDVANDGDGEFQRVDETLPTDFRCPSCRHEWSGKPKP